jgi:hypothetical protein
VHQCILKIQKRRFGFMNENANRKTIKYLGHWIF